MGREPKIAGGLFGLDDLLAECMRRMDAGERVDNESLSETLSQREKAE
jgi:hypothetical protein